MPCTSAACRFLRELLSNCTNSRDGLRDRIVAPAHAVAVDVQGNVVTARLKFREPWYSSGEVETPTCPSANCPGGDRWPLTNRVGQGTRCKWPRRRSRRRRQSRQKNLLRSVPRSRTQRSWSLYV